MQNSKTMTIVGGTLSKHSNITEVIFSPRRSVLALIDLAIILSSFNFFAWLSPYAAQSFKAEVHFFSFAYGAAFICLGVGLGFYDRSQRFTVTNIIFVHFLISILAFAVGTVTTYFVYYSIFGRLIVTWGLAGSYLSVAIIRFASRAYMLRHPYAFTILGSSPHLEELKSLANPEKRSGRLYRYVELQTEDMAPGSLLSKLMQKRIGVLVLGNQSLSTEDYVDLAVLAYRNGIRIVDETRFYQEIFERVPVDAISRQWAVSEAIDRQRILVAIGQRILDVSVAGFGLLIALIPMLIIACAIKLTSKGPVLFIQPRMGRFCEPFYMLKFRTMSNSQSRPDAGGGFTAKFDARVTQIGKLLRPLHLDELPQLLNILLGHMSIVGARPEALPFARNMIREIPLYELRYILRPGLTGHAQLSYGYAMDTVEDTKIKLSYDLFYLCNYTLMLDLRILLRTIFHLAKKSR